MGTRHAKKRKGARVSCVGARQALAANDDPGRAGRGTPSTSARRRGRSAPDRARWDVDESDGGPGPT
eukprot:1029521-Alexandrium_andersonii.AAC.1